MVDNSLLSLIVASVIWIIVWFIVKHKYPIRRLGTIYLTMYVMMFLMSLDLYQRLPNEYNNQNLFALLHYIIIITLFTLPLAKIDFGKINLIHPSSSKIHIVSIFIIIFSLLGVNETLQNLSTGIVGLLTEEDYGAQLYHELRTSSSFESKKGFGVSAISSVLSNIARGIAPLFSLYYLSRPKKNLLISIGLLFSAFMVVFNGISSGSRLLIVSSLMNIVGFLYVMNHYYPSKIKKCANIIVITITALGVVGIAAVTVSRATRGNYNPLESVEKYTSQANLIYGKYAFDAGGIRYGDRTIPLIKNLFTSDVARTYTDRLNKYSHMKVNESRFISFAGDFILDFGLFIGTVILVLIYTWLNTTLKPRKNIGVHYLIVVYIAIVILNGFYSYTFVDFGGNLQLISLILLYVFFKTNTRYKSSPNRNSPINI